jgi:hypothetical protein
MLRDVVEIGEHDTAPRARLSRLWWLAVAAVVVLATAVLGWGYFVGTDTDVTPATDPLVGRPIAVATEYGCPIETGSSERPNAIQIGDALLTAPGAFATTVPHAGGGKQTTVYLPPLAAAGKLRITRRWLRPVSYSYVAPGGTTVRLSAKGLPIAVTCQ